MSTSPHDRGNRKKIGLALSGGGFRATVYHLGLVRFLFDAGILQNVTHITAVSGGSIFAAHLCLNWERYAGSAEEFDAAAMELLAFIQLDVRNRILRRFPLALPLRALRRAAGLSNRKLTRTGLLEYHYERYLYGDTSLFQLPENPRLHILATNLSEGRLCSFNRDGLWLIRREAGHGFRLEKTRIGLGTVSMAVAASSAFPGFFPPMSLSGEHVGATSGEFGRQFYTDGGVYDNLGVRMFHFLATLGDADERGWDGVLVSDVGKPFQVQSSEQAGGLVRTAMRSSDILMDRVWQLENETFGDAAGFTFAPITDVIDPKEDPTALHPEVQRQLPRIRTDLDRFSPLEIASLIRQGYCAGRKACRRLPDVFGEVPSNPPWAPTFETSAAAAAATPLPSREATEITRDARALHSSGVRRIWSTLLDYRDWTSYVYVPIIVPILVLAPYLSAKYYEQSHRMTQIIESLAQGSRDLEQMSRLLEKPVPYWTGDKAEKLAFQEPPDGTGFTILQDSRIIDLRGWKSTARGSADSYVYGYRRLKVRRGAEHAANNNTFRVSVLALSPDTQVRFPAQQLKPKLYARPVPGSPEDEKLIHWEVGVDFAKVPVRDSADIVYEHLSPGRFLRDGIGSTTLAFDVEAPTIELTRWLLLPPGKEYRSWQMIRYPRGQPDASEQVRPVTEYLADDYSILSFKLLSLEPGYTYELTWLYR